MKILVMLLVALLAVWLWRSRGKPPADPRARPRSGQRRAGQPAPRELASPQPMVRCGLCGLHLPRHEAVAAPRSQAFYCCHAHLEEARRKDAAAPTRSTSG